MAYESTNIDPGASPSVGILNDNTGSGRAQGIKAIDPTAGSTTPIGTETNPEKVKPARRGTTDYDSGLVAVNDGAPASITASTIYPEGGTVSNPHTTQPRTLTLTTAADAPIGVWILPPLFFGFLPVPEAGAWPGLKAGAPGGGVVLHVAGRQ